MRFDTDQLLREAYCKEYFEETGARRAWQATKDKAARKKPLRAIPVLACVLTAVVVVAAVPTVRAAVQEFFTSIAGYMSAPAEERQALDGVTIQTDVMKAPSALEEFPVADKEDVVWIQDVGPMTVTEALYDGDKLYVNFEIDKGTSDLLYNYGAEYEETVDAVPEGGKATLHVTGPVILHTDANPYGLFGEEYQLEQTENGYAVSAVFGGQPWDQVDVSTLERAKDMELSLILYNAVLQKDGTDVIRMETTEEEAPEEYIGEWWVYSGSFGGTGTQEDGSPGTGGYQGIYHKQGGITVPLNIKTSSEMVETVTNQRLKINGVPSTVEYVRVKPYEIALSIMTYNTDGQGEGYGFDVYADGTLLERDENSSGFREERAFYNKQAGEDTQQKLPQRVPNSYSAYSYPNMYSYYHEIVIPFPQGDFKELKLVPYNETSGEKYEDDAIILPLEPANKRE